MAINFAVLNICEAVLVRLGFPRWFSGKESIYQCRGCRIHGFDPGLAKIPWRREWQPWLPFPPPGYVPDPVIQPASPTLAGGFFTAEPPGKPVTSNVPI